MKTALKEYSTVLSYHVLVTVSAPSEKEAGRIFSEMWEELERQLPSKKGHIAHLCTSQEVMKQMNHQDASKEFMEKWEEGNLNRPEW